MKFWFNEHSKKSMPQNYKRFMAYLAISENISCNCQSKQLILQYRIQLGNELKTLKHNCYEQISAIYNPWNRPCHCAVFALVLQQHS